MIDFGVTIPHYIECLPNSLFVKNIEYGERTLKSGFIIPAEKMDYEGHFARPRWAKVWRLGFIKTRTLVNFNGYDN